MGGVVREARRHQPVGGEGADGRDGKRATPLVVRQQCAAGGAGEAVR